MSSGQSFGDAPAEPGTELGGYRIEEQIGRGGMGVVYRAHDLALDRKVALKLLAPELAADVGFRERFHRESRLAASLDHPSVIPIYDAGEVAGQLYLAMRLVDGTDLKRLLAVEAPLEPARALRILGQVADALDAAHERGLVHRDVKPSNVLIDRRGHVYLADFGLSRLVGEAGATTTDARTLGTVAYVSPEQIRGEEVDGRADLYSLGCMLYECLTGRPPFTGPDTAVVFAHLQQAPPALTGPDPVIARALAKEPSERYGSGQALIEEAAAALGTRSGRKRRRYAAAAAVAALVAVGAAVAVVATRGASGDPALSSLVHIDARSGGVTGTRPVGHGASAVAVNGAGVWVAQRTDGSIWRLPPGVDDPVRTPVVGHPDGLAANDDQVLVSSSDRRTLTLLDPGSGAVVATKRRAGNDLGKIRVAAGPVTTRYADASPGVLGSLVARSSSGVEVSETPVPRTGRSFAKEYESFGGIAMDGNTAWASGGVFDHSLYRIPTTIPGPQAPVTRVPLPFAPGAVAAGGGLVWAAGVTEDRVITIDPSFGRNRVIGDVVVPRGVVGLAYASGALWIASAIDPVVSRLDLRSGTITDRVTVHGTPTAIAASGNDVWVAVDPARPAPSSSDAVVGLLTDCAASDRSASQRALAGASLPLLARGAERAAVLRAGASGAKAGGKEVTVVRGCADGTALSALAEARRLVESDGVTVLVGPERDSEELALVDYARRHPEVTFVDGAAGAELTDPPANVFVYHLDDAGAMAGLGAYAYRTLGWRRAAVIGDLADPFQSWAQIDGFAREFCALGGSIDGRVWFPRNVTTRAAADAALAGVPWKRVDGVVLLTPTTRTTGPDPLTAVYRHDFPTDRPFDHQLLLGSYIVGMTPGTRLVHGAPWRGSGPAVTAYRTALRRSFPRLDPMPQEVDVAYHDAMEAVLRGLEASSGDPSAPGFRAALAKIALDSAAGRITLDAHHMAMGRNLLLAEPATSLVRTVPGVVAGDPAGDPGTATPACTRGTLPPWVRRT